MERQYCVRWSRRLRVSVRWIEFDRLESISKLALQCFKSHARHQRVAAESQTDHGLSVLALRKRFRALTHQLRRDLQGLQGAARMVPRVQARSPSAPSSWRWQTRR